MNKLLVFILLGIFFVSFTSAADWDNKLDYEEKDMKVKFSNSFLGIIKLDEIGDIELKSHKSVKEVKKMSPGKDVVPMYYDFKNFKELYENGLGEVYFIDKKTGEYIEKDYHFVYLGTATKTVNDYDEKCEDVYNPTNKTVTESCKNILIGTHEEQYETWLPYDSLDIPSEDIRIGIATDVELSDHIDGIWTIAGKKVSKHAEWTASLNVDLLNYYKLDETTGSVIDSIQNINGTNNGATRGVNGIIDNAFSFDGTNDWVNLAGIDSVGTSWTLQFWINTTSGADNDYIFDADGTQRATVRFVSGNLNYNDDNNGDNVIISASSINNGDWVHVVIVSDGTAARFYVNGTNTNNATVEAVTIESSSGAVLGAIRPSGGSSNYDGLIDEVGFWNRSLSQAEITQLWNNGLGISWTDVFGIKPNVTLIFPENNANLTAQSVTFTANVTDAIKVDNVTLYIDGVANQTNTSGVNGTYTFSQTFANGDHNWSILAWNNQSLSNQSNTWDFNVNFTAPALSIISPLNITYATSSILFSVDASGVDDVDSCWYNLDGGNNVTMNNTFNGFCYQESANTTDQSGTDGDCSLNYTGTYSVDGSTTNPSNSYDGDFDTYGTYGSFIGTEGYYYVNYSKPNNSLNTSKIKIKGYSDSAYALESFEGNITILSNCFSQSVLQFRFLGDESGSGEDGNLYCFNGSEWEDMNLSQLYPFPGYRLYEEAMWWDISDGISESFFSYTNSSIPDGTYDTTFYCNSTSVNETNASVVFSVDTIPPKVDIIHPTNTSYNTVQTQLNYTVTNGNLDSCWYSLDGGSTNVSAPGCANVTGLDSGQGSSTWTVYANDTAGNENSSSVTFFVDSIPPSVTINSPINQTYTTSEILFSVGAADTTSSVDSCWYNLDGGENVSLEALNFTGFCYQESANTTNQTGIDGDCGLNYSGSYNFDNNLNDGNFSTYEDVTIDDETYYINYTKPNGALNTSLWRVSGTTDRNISISSSCWNGYTNELVFRVSFVAPPPTADISWYCHNGSSWELLSTETSSNAYEEAMWWDISDTYTHTNSSVPDGTYQTNYFCNDTLNNVNDTESVTFTIDTTSPIIDVESPNGTLIFNTPGNNETLNVTFTDSTLDSCWYNYNGTNVTIEGCVSGVKNSTQFILEANNFNMTVYANDTFGNFNSQFVEWTYLFGNWDIIYTTPQYESTLGTFTLNTTLANGGTIEEGIFEYNGTNYTTSILTDGDIYLITSSITLPGVDVDTNFTFSFYVVVDGVTYNFLSKTQEVQSINFITCVGDTDLLMNISLFDEEDRTSILGNLELNLQVYSKTSDDVVAEFNNTFENISSQAICLSPNESFSNLYLDAEIRYFSDDYATEFYYIQEADMNDYPIDLSLYDLKLNDSTEFVVTYKNNAFIFTEGAVIQLQRKYIGEDIYEVVEAPLTSDGGKTILHIDLNSNKYRASVVKDGELLDFFDNIVFSCENELAGDCTYSFEGAVSPNNDIPIETITDFSYSVSINEDDQTVTVLFAVPSGTPSNINVLLNQIDTFGNSTACNTTVITSAGSITCDYTDTIEKSILELSISKDGVQLAVLSAANDPELDMGGMNFFIAFLFMISLVGMAIASPEWMIIISVMVLVISGTLLLLNGMNLVMGLGAIAWVIIAAAIIIFKMAKQEDR